MKSSPTPPRPRRPYRRALAALALAGIALSGAGIAAARTENAHYLTADGAIRIGGAEHVRFIVERVNALYAKAHPGTRFQMESKGTTSAIPLLTYGVTLFGAMGREIDPLESASFAKTVGAPPLEIRVAHTSNDTSQHLATSLAVYVNRANPIDRLTTAQIARIFAQGNPGGDYSRWGQLGLDKDWKSRLIHPIGTPEYTGFGTYMQKYQLAGRPLAAGYEAYGDTDAILERLEQDPAGIAVAAIGRETPALKQVAVATDPNGPYTLGTPEEVTAGTYAYGRYLYFYLRREPGKPLDPVVKAYMRLVLSPEGQAIMASQAKGYIPLTAAEAKAELAKLD
ncbi:MAG: substrate-binding domain-containing protein [Azospirillaceae bacterium]|nr:substrate-binding domain-containing protein [Azospirillaceae bacterium]